MSVPGATAVGRTRLHKALFHRELRGRLDDEDQTVLSKNRQRLIEHHAVVAFCNEVLAQAKRKDWLSKEHFSVDGTRVQAWAGHKSFVRKGSASDGGSSDGSDRGSSDAGVAADFRGQPRSNELHASTTDPDSRLYRKGQTASELRFMGRTLMENRNGLIVNARVTRADGCAEREAAKAMIFSALGDEAFVPSTDTHRRALFVVEEAASPVGTWTGGLRIERAKVASAGDAEAGEGAFGPPDQRTFTLRSASLGDQLKLGDAWTVSASFSSTARAPTSFELYANGVHAATGAYERGDAGLGIERGNNLDLALQWKADHDHLRLGVWTARFPRFISLEASGRTITRPNDDGEPEAYPEYVFKAVRARLEGIELEASHRIAVAAWTFDLLGRLDGTRATDRDAGQPLPRIAPLRATLGVDIGRGPWQGEAEVQLSRRQTRVPDDDSETGGYALVNLGLSRHFDLYGADAYWFVKATNVFDHLAYSASTVETIRGLSPLAGRAVKTGLRVSF